VLSFTYAYHCYCLPLKYTSSFAVPGSQWPEKLQSTTHAYIYDLIQMRYRRRCSRGNYCLFFDASRNAERWTGVQYRPISMSSEYNEMIITRFASWSSAFLRQVTSSGVHKHWDVITSADHLLRMQLRVFRKLILFLAAPTTCIPISGRTDRLTVVEDNIDVSPNCIN